MARLRPLAALAKPELHLHIEGSVRWPTAREFVRAAGRAELPETPPWAAPGWRYPDFDAFQNVFRLYLHPAFACAAQYARIARELAEDLARQNVRYVELNFAPGVVRCAGFPVGAAIEAMLEGFAEVPRAPHLALITGYSRDKGPEDALMLAQDALTHPAIAGIDLHGAGEAEWPPHLFRTVFDRARARGLLLKAHAGEFAGPESIAGALDDLGVERLGHAVALAQDPALAERVKSRRVVLETCPTSNVMLGRVSSAAEHPLRDFLRAGHRVTVSSDDRLQFWTDVGREYEVLRREIGCTDEEIAAVAREGFAAARAPESLRAEWIAEVDAWLV